MKKRILLLGLATVSAAFASMTSNAQSTIDPIGFCPPPATVATCTTATGPGGETIGVGATTFGMFSNAQGAGTPSPINPWFLFVLVPEATDGAALDTPPVLTSVGGAFTQVGATIDKGDFTSSTAGSIYTFTGTTGDGSMNASNLFGSIEQAVFGGTPADFEVFEYAFSPNLLSWTPYQFNVSGAGLPAGTWLAASGGSNPFSTPFTTAGLACGYPPPGGPPLCGNQPPPPLPEPATLALLGLGLVGIGLTSRRRSASA